MIDPKRHSGPLPLIVGVTGHRDIADDDVAAVREMTGRVLASLRKSFPWSEIQLLTALAEGADQLAAEVAVSLGVPLIAVSPMPLAAYEATFAADAGRKTLHRLWSAALTRMELPPVADAPGGMLEKLQYEQAGLVISRTSHVLLALWNGLEAWEPGASEAERRKMQGGTAHIVYLRAAGEQNSQVFRQSRIFPERAGLFDFGGNGPTLRVAVARQTVPGRAGAPGSLWQLRAAEAAKEIAPDTLAAVWTSSDPSHDASGHGERETPLARLDAANRLMSEYAGGREDELERAKTFVLPLGARKTLGDQQPPVEMILNAYAHADIVAQSNQRNTNRAIFGLAAALPVAVLAFELYAHVWTKPEMLMVYLGVIVFAFALYFWGLRRGQWQNRFQDHRALARGVARSGVLGVERRLQRRLRLLSSQAPGGNELDPRRPAGPGALGDPGRSRPGAPASGQRALGQGPARLFRRKGGRSRQGPGSRREIRKSGVVGEHRLFRRSRNRSSAAGRPALGRRS